MRKTVIEKSPENAKARHEAIKYIYTDILCDLNVCRIEGWDYYEYVDMLKDMILGVEKRIKKYKKEDKENGQDESKS